MLNNLTFDKTRMPNAQEILPGRVQAIKVGNHFVNGRPLRENWQPPLKTILLGMGCFWGAEHKLGQVPHVYVTAAGYAGGTTPNPTYEEVCTGRTGHAEVVLVVYDSEKLPLAKLLQIFWQSHDPTQYMRQGADIGTSYRSYIDAPEKQDYQQAIESQRKYDGALSQKGFGQIVTQITHNTPFYYAEDYHQQNLAKNPDGYCALKGIDVACPI